MGFCSLGLGFRHLQTDVFKELVVQVSITANGDLAKVMSQLQRKRRGKGREETYLHVGPYHKSDKSCCKLL